MRTARFLTLGLFLASMMLVIGCGGDGADPQVELPVEDDEATMTDDSTMIETGADEETP
jgi:hypothetical protein